MKYPNYSLRIKVKGFTNARIARFSITIKYVPLEMSAFCLSPLSLHLTHVRTNTQLFDSYLISKNVRRLAFAFVPVG